MGATQKAVFDRLLEFEQQCLEHHPQSQAGGEGGYWDGVVYRLDEFFLTSSIQEIEEIIPVGDITPIPGAKPWLLGLANIRGNLTTIVDLGGYVFGQRTPLGSSSRLLLSSLQNRPMALLVDEVFGQRHFAQNQVVSESPENRKADPQWDSIALYVEREFRLDDRNWGVFSINRLSKQEDFLDGAA